MAKKRKPRKEAQLIVAVFITLFLILCISVILFFISKHPLKFGNTGKEPLYESVSLTEEASAQAYVWLSRIEDMPLSYRDVKEIMGDISLTLILTPTEEDGIYARSLDDASYEECLDHAQEGLLAAYREVVRCRLTSAEHDENNSPEELSDELLDEIMQSAYGLSVAEYLSSCELQLLPAKDELMEIYAGEVAYE